LINVSMNEIKLNIMIETGEEAIKHLAKLTSGLDSLVIGEDQILGQVKRSIEFSRKNGFSGPNLNILFERTIKTGSKVRAATGINKGSMSIGSMAVNLAYEYFDDISEKNILLIGSGEGASLIAKTLKQRGIKFFISSRTFERAKSFSDTVAGNPIPFEEAIQKLCSEIDIVFISTVAPYYLLTYERMAEIMEKNIRKRKKEIQSAEKIIDEEIFLIKETLKRKSSEPVIITIFKDADSIREKELKKALTLIGDKINDKEMKIFEQFSYALVEGILSTPMNNLRKEFSQNNENNNELINLALKLFNYEKL